jgi:propanol-preferring alcohol dehydrogenase
MKAIRMVQVGQPLVEFDLHTPQIGENDVLVRVQAAGICHSDAHYRAGRSPVEPLPLTLGHEVAGVVEMIGAKVLRRKPGDRVALHYLVTCGECAYCRIGAEQYCVTGKMLGHTTDGGYAEFIAVPERNAVLLPEEISFKQGATLMCASATAFHALRKSRLKGGERVAVFGAGGLGISAIQLARVFGAIEVFAVDIREENLELAARCEAIPVNASQGDAVKEIRSLTQGQGVDVALEMVGLPQTMRQALRSLAVFGRAVIVGLSDQSMEFHPYTELLGPEAELIGSNDHLLSELPLVIEYARQGILDASIAVSRRIPLQAAAVNQALDELEAGLSPIPGAAHVRTVIIP